MGIKQSYLLVDKGRAEEEVVGDAVKTAAVDATVWSATMMASELDLGAVIKSMPRSIPQSTYQSSGERGGGPAL